MLLVSLGASLTVFNGVFLFSGILDTKPEYLWNGPQCIALGAGLGLLVGVGVLRR